METGCGGGADDSCEGLLDTVREWTSNTMHARRLPFGSSIAHSERRDIVKPSCRRFWYRRDVTREFVIKLKSDARFFLGWASTQIVSAFVSKLSSGDVTMSNAL
jgi:hypothetical protein